MDDLNSILSDQGNNEQPQEAAQETAQPVEQQQPTGEESATPAPQQDDPIETHRKGLETAVVAERRKRQEAEAKAQALEQRIAEFERSKQEAKQPDGPPDPAQFQDNPEEYWRQLARYEVREEMKAAQVRSEAERERAKQEQAVANFRTAAEKVVSDGSAEFPDFTPVVNAGLGPFLNPTMQQALVFTPNGHKVAYYLGKNPAEAARISQLEPIQMLMELGELRSKVNAPKRVELPQTLTQERNAQGRFKPADDIPSLEAILGR